MTSPALKGAIIALVLIAYNLGLYLSGQYLNTLLSIIPIGILGLSLTASCFIYAKQSPNKIGFGDTFAESFKAASAITCLMCLYTFLSLKYIMTDVVVSAVAQEKKEMVLKGMPSSEIQESLLRIKEYFIPQSVGSVLIRQQILGMVFSLIAAAIVTQTTNKRQQA